MPQWCLLTSRMVVWAFVLIGLVLDPACANLLRNAKFQSDWLTRRAELKNHNWNYPEAFYNRRDYHPDVWVCQGNWKWLNPDAREGERQLILEGPQSRALQAVNWAAIYDDRKFGGSPDFGGYPLVRAYASVNALSMTSDLRLRVRVKGDQVASDAGGITVLYAEDDPAVYQTPKKVLAAATQAWPSGTYGWRWLEVQLTADAWLEAMQAQHPTLPDQVSLPLSAWVQLEYLGQSGKLEVAEVQLLADEAGAANLLPNGGFEDVSDADYPLFWEPPSKYTYFPPRHYYIFNTWHHTTADNRGPVVLDPLIVHGGQYSLKMIVPPGDEKMVMSAPIPLNQTEPRAIEVQGWVKTDRLSMLQIDAIDQDGRRLDGFNWIQKQPYATGTDGWRQIRQVFHPRSALEHIRIQLAARGVNGYTLDDTGYQPQHNVVGTVWWDSIEVFEPETEMEALRQRNVTIVPTEQSSTPLHLTDVQFDENLLGRNMIRATLSEVAEAGDYGLSWQMTSPSGQTYRFASSQHPIETGQTVAIDVPYEITELTTQPYSAYQAELAVLKDGQEVESTPMWLSTWTHVIDLELGALYLLPEQQQMVRVNLGVSADSLPTLKRLDLAVLRRGTGEVLQKWDVPISLERFEQQRQTIPEGLREDFRNLLLHDLDVSFLPLQPFHDPQRNWVIQATLISQEDEVIATATSQPFCRQDHEPPQEPIRSVDVQDDNLLYVNGQPWMPWGAVYGHMPVYAGPAVSEPASVQDLRQMPLYSVYDRWTTATYNRHTNDLNTLRYVAGSPNTLDKLEPLWADDNLYASSVFVAGHPVWSVTDLAKPFGGETALQDAMQQWKTAPMVVATAPGVEEAFGLFTGATDSQLEGLQTVVQTLRNATAKPVMVGHGGYWNRFEFERVPFFDIYDPETEPLYPANVHTDLWPLVQGQAKVVWLRPQMYEDVPYERWRFHVYVELMRGVRGWQIAHGPGDASLFRGLHGELEYFKPIVYSRDPGPDVRAEPPLELWSRQYQNHVYVIAASTHGMQFGQWREVENPHAAETTVRLTEAPYIVRDEANAYGLIGEAASGWRAVGIQYLPNAKGWPKESYISQQLTFDADAAPAPASLVLLVKADGRWTHAASWGEVDLKPLRQDGLNLWFLHGFYRHAVGFLGWGNQNLTQALDWIPDRAINMGTVPSESQTVEVQVPLDALGVVDKQIDGIAWMHPDGRVYWGKTEIVSSDGVRQVIWDNGLGPQVDELRATKIVVPGLQKGQPVRVLFEDRTIAAEDGYFVDDFSGVDLYQRYGGGDRSGYGNKPVALHLYEVEIP